MRVCFISRRFFPAISGMSVYALNLLRELVAARHDVTMFSQYRGDEFGKRVYGGGPPPPVPGVRVVGMEQLGEQTSGDFERDIATMVDAVCAEHAQTPFDVLHAQYGYPCGWMAMEAARRIGVPVVVSIQGGDGHWVGSCCETHRRAMVDVLDHANAVLIGCDSFREEVVDRLGTAPARFTIVPGAVDTGRFTPGGTPPDDPPVMLYHGRVDARKGVLDLLAAVRKIVDSGTRFRLLISGIGPTFDETAVAIPAMGLADHVEMTGYIDYDRVPEIYRRAGIFVSPTYAEGFSNTILEAMASRMAVVSCRSVGVVDCIRDGENGLLTEPGDIGGLAAALHRVLQDGALRDRLADAALIECRSVYSWAKVGRQIMDVYANVAGHPPDLAYDPALPLTPCRFRTDPHLL